MSTEAPKAKSVEFRSKAPNLNIHMDEKVMRAGANRQVAHLVKVEFTPVGGPPDEALKNGGRFVTTDEEKINFLRQHTGNVANGGRDYIEVGPSKGLDVDIEDELRLPAKLRRANKKPS